MISFSFLTDDPCGVPGQRRVPALPRPHLRRFGKEGSGNPYIYVCIVYVNVYDVDWGRRIRECISISIYCILYISHIIQLTPQQQSAERETVPAPRR